MPDTLDKTYERILASIDDLYFDEVRTALEWLAFSTRPLSVAEMAEVCSIRLDDSGEPYLDQGGHAALLGLLGVISSLVLVENRRGSASQDFTFGESYPDKYDTSCYPSTIRLAHFSVKEYLVSDRLQQSDARFSRFAVRESQAHMSLSQSCCAYFLYFTKEPNIRIWIEEEKEPIPESSGEHHYVAGQDYLDDFTPAYPLLPYVCRQWAHHQRLAEIDTERLAIDNGLHMRILADEAVRVSWLRLIGDRLLKLSAWCSRGSPSKILALRDWHDDTTSLYWATDLGLRQTVSRLCASMSRQDVCNVGGVYHTAAQCAAYRGDEKILETLMGSGADVHHEGGVFRTTLQAAAISGNSEIVEVLLKNGTKVTYEGGHFGTSLLAAAHCGHTSIVLQLLDTNPEVGVLNIRLDTYGTALDIAAGDGNERMVEALLQAGADHGVAMLKAVARDHTGIAQIFINHGANLNIQHVDGFRRRERRWVPGPLITVLQSAVDTASEEMVEVLIQAGADVASSSNALLLSAAKGPNEMKGGHAGKFDMLVQAGAQIDPSSDDLLIEAIKGRSVPIVEKLLHAGSSVVGKHIPLIAAVGTNSDAMVRLLLQAGADITGDSLSAAAARGHVIILSLLLDAGVYPTNVDHSAQPLSPGLFHNYNHEFQSCKQIALMRAIEFWRNNLYKIDVISRCSAMIQKLVEAGADIHTGNDAALYQVVLTGRQNLGARAQEGILKLVQLLLTNGANIDAQNSIFKRSWEDCRPSILYTAVETGITKLVQLLIAHGADLNGHGWTRNSPSFLTGMGYREDSKHFLDRYDSILLGGIRAGNMEMVKLLLDSGADVKTLDAAEAHTLIVAAILIDSNERKGELDHLVMGAMVVDRLLEIRGADDALFDDDVAMGVAMERFGRGHPFSKTRWRWVTKLKELVKERRAVSKGK
jgi:ankyrin repeat protein